MYFKKALLVFGILVSPLGNANTGLKSPDFTYCGHPLLFKSSIPIRTIDNDLGPTRWWFKPIALNEQFTVKRVTTSDKDNVDEITDSTSVYKYLLTPITNLTLSDLKVSKVELLSDTTKKDGVGSDYNYIETSYVSGSLNKLRDEFSNTKKIVFKKLSKANPSAMGRSEGLVYSKVITYKDIAEPSIELEQLQEITITQKNGHTIVGCYIGDLPYEY